jgi:hypothetical protein
MAIGRFIMAMGRFIMAIGRFIMVFGRFIIDRLRLWPPGPGDAKEGGRRPPKPRHVDVVSKTMPPWRHLSVVNRGVNHRHHLGGGDWWWRPKPGSRHAGAGFRPSFPHSARNSPCLSFLSPTLHPRSRLRAGVAPPPSSRCTGIKAGDEDRFRPVPIARTFLNGRWVEADRCTGPARPGGMEAAFPLLPSAHSSRRDLSK